jgi:hypothetical protein
MIAMKARSVWGWLLLLNVVTGCGGSGRDEDAVKQQSSALTTTEHRIGISAPSGTDFRTFALGTNDSFQVGDRAQVKAAVTGTFAPISNTGSVTSGIGVSAQTGSITSVAPVTLHDRAQVTGSVTSGGGITLGNGVVVTGALAPNTALGIPDIASWRVEFPQSTQSVILQASQTANLLPGAYSSVTINRAAQVTLHSGAYYIDQLDLEPQGSIKLDESAGPIFVYVQTSLIYRGNLTGGTVGELLVAYLGSQLVTVIESPFSGTLLAPNATVRLGVGGTAHSGSVFPKDLQVDPDVQFNFVPFAGWASVPFDVTPILTCVEKRADNTFAALLGYYNPNANPATAPVGANNSFSTSPQDRGQPTGFLAGRFPTEFSVDFVGISSMTWQLDGNSLAIATSATACPTSFTASLVQDTTVALSSPEANFGSTRTLTIASGSDALVQFDRGQLKKTLGAGRYVTKAVLTLSQTSGAQPAVDALAMTRRWTELGATWDCVNDTDPSATGETCAPGDTWTLDRDDLTQKNPWHVFERETAVRRHARRLEPAGERWRSTSCCLGARGISGRNWLGRSFIARIGQPANPYPHCRDTAEDSARADRCRRFDRSPQSTDRATPCRWRDPYGFSGAGARWWTGRVRRS